MNHNFQNEFSGQEITLENIFCAFSSGNALLGCRFVDGDKTVFSGAVKSYSLWEIWLPFVTENRCFSTIFNGQKAANLDKAGTGHYSLLILINCEH